jgi:hypothetical protein
MACGDTEQRAMKEAAVAEFRTTGFWTAGREESRKISTEIYMGSLLNAR